MSENRSNEGSNIKIEISQIIDQIENSPDDDLKAALHKELDRLYRHLGFIVYMEEED